jgi:D-glycero-D-manno-heptose 1,7-bisphosphate phosphatase
MSKTTVDSILRELSVFDGKVFSRVPPEGISLGSRDVLFLQSWDVAQLLKVARQQACQVALYSEDPLPEELLPFCDWQIVDSESKEVLLKKSQNLPSMAEIKNLQKKSALFLDRDGVVNVDYNFVGDPKNVDLVAHIGSLVKKANQSGKDVVVVTNQSGIGRGYYSDQDFQLVMKRISELLNVEGAKIDVVEHSPFHPQAHEEKYRQGQQFRKPRPGMIHKAAQARGIDLSRSLLVGDHAKDLMAAVLAGIGNIYLFTSNKENTKMRLDFENWIQVLQHKHHLNHLMDGISFHVVNDLDKVEL